MWRMDTKCKITDSCGSATPVTGESEKREQPVTGEEASGIESVISQLVAPERLCPGVLLGERCVDAVDEEEVPEPVIGETSPSIVEDEEVKKSIELAIDIIGHPKKTKNFKWGDKLLGKKASKKRLSQASEKLKGKITPENRHNLNPSKNLNEQALGIVSKKLNKARAMKAVKIGIPIVSGIASVVATAATLGASAPVTVPLAIAAGAAIAGTVADSGKAVAEAASEE
jgi:hypothetical protein